MENRISVSELIGQIKECEESNRKTKNPDFRIGRIIITPEVGFDSSKERHPLEDILLKNGFDYDFKGSYIGDQEIYDLDLRHIKIIYPAEVRGMSH